MKKEITTISLRGNREYTNSLAILAREHDVKVADIVRFAIDILTDNLNQIPDSFFAEDERQIEQQVDSTIIQTN